MVKPVSGACQVSEDETGACSLGYCELAEAEGTPCTSADDCEKANNPCRRPSCTGGACAYETADDGAECASQGGVPGVCRQGLCVFEDSDLQSQEQCKTVRSELTGRVREKCKDSLAFVLDPEARRDAEREIEEKLTERLRYDMAVRLVWLPTGGYNIVTYNRKSRDEVQGLCDPSFVAFTLASYTQGTNWRSRALHIWVSPSDEGWGIRTAGSRDAMSYGRASSGWLGNMLGVVNVKAFRTWLEKEFVPLTTRGSPITAKSDRADSSGPSAGR